jgi:hypothetical protein
MRTEKLGTIVFTADDGDKIIKVYETLDKLRSRFVHKDNALAFMYSDTNDRPYNGLERGLLCALYKMAGIEPDYFFTAKVYVYDTVEEQEEDNQGPFFK